MFFALKPSPDGEGWVRRKLKIDSFFLNLMAVMLPRGNTYQPRGKFHLHLALSHAREYFHSPIDNPKNKGNAHYLKGNLKHRRKTKKQLYTSKLPHSLSKIFTCNQINKL